MSQKPTVGRIVHFYSKALEDVGQIAGKGFNGQGAGPYAAMITQVGDVYVNLKVFTPLGPILDEGSVGEKNAPFAAADRYWEWPPMVPAVVNTTVNVTVADGASAETVAKAIAKQQQPGGILSR